MILPTKGLAPDRALITLGAGILEALDTPSTVSRLWYTLEKRWVDDNRKAPLTFDWFVLALDFLYSIDAIDRSCPEGLITKVDT